MQNLAARDGVQAVLVVSNDGLTIDQIDQGGPDLESVAALVPALAQAAHQVGEASEGGALTLAVLEFKGRMLVVSTLHEGMNLIVLTAADANIGQLLYDLHRHRPALIELL